MTTESSRDEPGTSLGSLAGMAPVRRCQAPKIVVRGAREHNLQEHQRRAAARPADRVHRAVRLGQVAAWPSTPSTPRASAATSSRSVAYARQFLGQMDKPDVDVIEGLSPAISIDQKSASRNPRSTVGTITEVYDYLRLLYARIGVQHCPNDGTRLQRQTPQQIVDRILLLPDGTRFQVLAPVVRGRKGEYDTLLDDLAGQGYVRARIDGEVVDIAEFLKRDERLARYEQHTIEIVVDRLVLREGIERRLTDSLETALRLADGVAEVEIVAARRRAEGETLTFSQHLACPTCGTQLRRAGAAQLLVQLAVRRVRDVRRPRHDVRGRPGAGRPRPRPVDHRRRDRAVAQRAHAVLHAHARGGRRDVRHRPRHAVAQAHRQAAEGRPARRRAAT